MSMLKSLPQTESCIVPLAFCYIVMEWCAPCKSIDSIKKRFFFFFKLVIFLRESIRMCFLFANWLETFHTAVTSLIHCAVMLETLFSL